MSAIAIQKVGKNTVPLLGVYLFDYRLHIHINSSTSVAELIGFILCITELIITIVFQHK